MDDRGPTKASARPSHAGQDGAGEARASHPGAARFTAIRQALCRTLDHGRHWSARNMIAACGTWRELQALFGRDLPTHDAQILRVRLDSDGTAISIVMYNPLERVREPALGQRVARLVEGVDY